MMRISAFAAVALIAAALAALAPPLSQARAQAPGPACGAGFCPPNSVCLEGGQCGLLPKPGQPVPGMFATPDGGYCPIGTTFVDGGFCRTPYDTTPCGGPGKYCPQGWRCDGNTCVGRPAGPICAGGGRCASPHNACMSDPRYCYYPEYQVDCGGGRFCMRGQTCLPGGRCAVIVARVAPRPASAFRREQPVQCGVTPGDRIPRKCANGTDGCYCLSLHNSCPWPMMARVRVSGRGIAQTYRIEADSRNTEACTAASSSQTATYEGATRAR